MGGTTLLAPGSMGSSSFGPAGNGNNEALKSASHGGWAGHYRAGEATRTAHREFEQFLDEFHIVTPLDSTKAHKCGTGPRYSS